MLAIKCARCYNETIDSGLGVLFGGFFTMCANRSGKLRKALGMEKGEKAVTTLVLGWPKVRYHRTVRRDPAKIRRL